MTLSTLCYGTGEELIKLLYVFFFFLILASFLLFCVFPDSSFSRRDDKTPIYSFDSRSSSGGVAGVADLWK